MELEFQKTQLPCLATVLRKAQEQEQTQEVRISDGMPDIGTILGAWGQVILRGKEWDAETLTVSGGATVWVQYLPEEGGAPLTVEGWLPFQMRWTIPPTDHDGIMMVQCSLKNADCRCVSARKLMLRANVSILLHAMRRQQLPIFTPGDVPEDVQLHIVEYPVLLPAEAGERAFELEETLPNKDITRILSAQIQPQVTESRIISDKVIFRGSAMVTVLGENQNGTQMLFFELPFSQYSELDQSYDDGEVVIWPSVTSVETELTEEGIGIKAGLVCQYEIRHRPVIRIVEDAYSPARQLEMTCEELVLPGILESKSRTLHAMASVEGMEVRNAQMLVHPVLQEKRDGGMQLSIPVNFQVLCSDMDGALHYRTDKWEETNTIPVGENVRIETALWPVGNIQTSSQGGNIRVQGDLILQTDCRLDMRLPMVTGLELGQETTPDPNRPSLILRRTGELSLWQIARETGSSVEDIRRLNGISTEPDPEQMLLIPIK